MSPSAPSPGGGELVLTCLVAYALLVDGKVIVDPLAVIGGDA
jgi:hypothetical protein